MKNNQYFIGNDLYEFLQQAKEMEQSQAQLYATFCFMCANKNIPIIEFKDWIDLTYGGNK
ncbi:hypothetical protein [Runella sp.]|uniref:hypothetical protein n=1 Tax=Runella sp. TaxID=1960881 RepID=UPI0030169C65